MKKVDLGNYNSDDYKPGSTLKKALPFLSKIKALLLNKFGASIEYNVVIKPNVNIKYPWFLRVGSNVWIGEGVWIETRELEF